MSAAGPGVSPWRGARSFFPPLASAPAVAALAALLVGAAKAPGFDEGKTLAFLGHGWADGLRFVAANESSPPLYFLLLKAVCGAFPDPLPVARMFSTACVVAALVVFRRGALRDAPAAAPAAAMLAALSPLWLYAASEARMYGLLLFLGVLQEELAGRLRRGDRSPGAYALYAAASVAASWTHFYGLLMTAVQGARLCWADREDHSRLARAVGLHLAVALSLAPWAAWTFGRQAGLVADGHIDPVRIGSGLRVLGAMLAEPGFLAFLDKRLMPAAGAVTFLLVALAARGTRPGSAGRGALGLLGGTAAVFALAGLTTARPLIQPRHFVAWSPLLYLALAEWTADLARPARLGARSLVFALAVAGCGAQVFAAFVLDPRLERWAEGIRRADSRAPVVHLEAQYFLALRERYLPERAHYAAPGASHGAFDDGLLPRYDGRMDSRRLGRMGVCVVVDPARRLGGAPLALRPCAAAALSD